MPNHHTCSSCILTEKTAVGVVVKENEYIMMTHLENIPWSPDHVDISGVLSTTSWTVAATDFLGKSNTQAIVDYYGEDAENVGAVYCYNYMVDGVDTAKANWFMPAGGELLTYVLAENNCPKIMTVLHKLGETKMKCSSEIKIRSSTEAHNISSYDGWSYGLAYADKNRTDSRYITCLRSIK